MLLANGERHRDPVPAVGTAVGEVMAAMAAMAAMDLSLDILLCL